jgi:hypothetical protein
MWRVPMSEANKEAPVYYQSAYMHWDFAVKVGLGYLDGCSTKYVARWRGKEGLKDLKKAWHYLEKLIEVGDYSAKRRNIIIDVELQHFVEANNLTFLESQYLFLLCTYRNEKALKDARLILAKIINTAVKEEEAKTRIREEYKPGTPEDGGHHAKMEE